MVVELTKSLRVRLFPSKLQFVKSGITPSSVQVNTLGSIAALNAMTERGL